MKKQIGTSTIELVQGDITLQDTDVIVNAANKSLLGGGGVDGAIHRAGGPAILEECRKLGGCNTGDAKITTAGNLRAKHIVHTVGPVYRDGKHGEPDLLASCHRRSLALAHESGAGSIAFPAISTGVYGYPINQAAAIALETTAEFLKANQGILLVRFVLFDRNAFDAFASQLAQLA